MDKTLLTGATGLVGSALARQLLEEGREVRVLVRSGSDTRNLAGLDLERVTGDLCEPRSLAAAVRGCKSVFHAAAKVAFWVPLNRRAEFYDVNVIGTRNLLHAAFDHGVERFIHTSTVSAIGIAPGKQQTTEDDYYSLWHLATDYEHSKFAAEYEVMRFAARGFPVISVLPTAPLGPRDRTPGPVGQIVLDYLDGKLPLIEGGLNLVDVDDVAAGHLLAAERGQPGERYIIGHADVTLSEVFAVLERVSGIPSPKLRLPYPVGLAAGHVLEFVANRISNRPPMLTPSMIKMASRFYYANWEKARKELGYQPRSNPLQAATKSILWFLDNGYVSGDTIKKATIRRHAESIAERPPDKTAR